MRSELDQQQHGHREAGHGHVDAGKRHRRQPVDRPLGGLRSEEAGEHAARHHERDGLGAEGGLGRVGGGQPEVPEERRLHALQHGRDAHEREALLVERRAADDARGNAEQRTDREAGPPADRGHQERGRDGGAHDAEMHEKDRHGRQPLVVGVEQHVGGQRRGGDAHALHRHEQRLRQRQHGDVAALRSGGIGRSREGGVPVFWWILHPLHSRLGRGAQLA